MRILNYLHILAHDYQALYPNHISPRQNRHEDAYRRSAASKVGQMPEGSDFKRFQEVFCFLSSFLMSARRAEGFGLFPPPSSNYSGLRSRNSDSARRGLLLLARLGFGFSIVHWW